LISTVTGELAFQLFSASMLYSALVLIVIVVIAALAVTDSVQRMYTGKHKSFEYDIMEMAIATSYLSLIVLPCVRLREYGRATSFINSWRNLEVTEVNCQYLGEAVRNKNQVYVSNSIKEIFNFKKLP